MNIQEIKSGLEQAKELALNQRVWDVTGDSCEKVLAIWEELSQFVVARKEYAKKHVEHSTRVVGYEKAFEALDILIEFYIVPSNDYVKSEVISACAVVDDFVEEYAPELDESKLSDRM